MQQSSICQEENLSYTNTLLFVMLEERKYMKMKYLKSAAAMDTQNFYNGEVITTIAGTIGLLLAVPIATVLAASFFTKADLTNTLIAYIQRRKL